MTRTFTLRLPLLPSAPSPSATQIAILTATLAHRLQLDLSRLSSAVGLLDLDKITCEFEQNSSISVKCLHDADVEAFLEEKLCVERCRACGAVRKGVPGAFSEWSAL